MYLKLLTPNLPGGPGSPELAGQRDLLPTILVVLLHTEVPHLSTLTLVERRVRHQPEPHGARCFWPLGARAAPKRKQEP